MVGFDDGPIANESEHVKTRQMNTDMYGRGSQLVRSPVDIIVPFHGEYSRVSTLVNSILTYTSDHPYVITLVDDCSPNKAFGNMINSPKQNIVGGRQIMIKVGDKEVPLVKCIRLKEKTGFGGAVNAGINSTANPLVLIMHSDCEVKSRLWLLNLVNSLVNMKRMKVKMVSAKSDKPGDNYPKALKKGHGGDMMLKGDVLKDSAYIPLYCALANRELFSHVGLFREYEYTWYEDLEFAYRMNLFGFKQGISGESWVNHVVSSTVKALWKKHPKVKEVMEANRSRCISDIKNLKMKSEGVNTLTS